ncbi:hypothetical protein F5Y15DRAFT_418933 [Xylariaceae sp. FL0016]|nr:hypothetical protein F5Y15DRAFT_418933 [Xylariaceae sp. FL0016]
MSRPSKFLKLSHGTGATYKVACPPHNTGKANQEVNVTEAKLEDEPGLVVCSYYLDPYNGFYPGKFTSFPFSIRQIPGKGYGVIATRALPKGTPILIETAVLLNDDNITQKSLADLLEQFNALPKPLWNAVNALHLSTTPQAQLLAKAAKPYLEAMSQQIDGTPLHKEKLAKIEGVIGRVDSNSFDFKQAGSTKGRCALFLAASRFNHSCVCNTKWETRSWSSPLANTPLQAKDVTITFWACRDITAGEEITADYVDRPGWTAEQRRDKTERLWGFACQCEACRDEDAAQHKTTVRNPNSVYGRLRELRFGHT